MPCQNGGTCHERCTDEPDYECICPPDFDGKNCTSEVKILFIIELVNRS